MLRVTDPTFVAGLVLLNGRVHRAAPILGYMRGWSTAKAIAYILDHQCWTVELLP